MTDYTPLPPSVHTLLDGRNYAVVATVEPSGHPQLSVVWVKRDGDDVLFSTTAGRRKGVNLARDPRSTVLVYDLQDPDRYVEVRGVTQIVEDPQGELIEELSLKYDGRPWNDSTAGRVIVRLRPTKVVDRS